MIDLTKLRKDAMGIYGEWYTAEMFESEFGRNEAAHIANLSPSTAIALIEAVEAAQCVLSDGKPFDLLGRLYALREALRPFTKE